MHAMVLRLPGATISIKACLCCTGSITLDDADDGWQGHVPKGVHADDLEGLPGRAEGHGHRPHSHRICTGAPPLYSTDMLGSVQLRSCLTSVPTKSII